MAAPLLLLARQFSPAATADAELLARFARGRDNDAFAELVRRHGPVVYRICRRLVGHTAADDAFQVTFLLLATRTGAAQAASSIGGWLVGVAGRVARQMRRAAYRRENHEKRAASRKQEAVVNSTPDLIDQFRILDEELTRLPDRLREPLVSCLLQGQSQEQAAAEAGHTTRTVRRRLEEAKQLLRTRLQSRGVTAAVALGLVTGLESVSTAIPCELVTQTMKVLSNLLSGGTPITPPVLLAKGVTMNILARKIMLLMVAITVSLTSLGWVLAQASRPGEENPTAKSASEMPPVQSVKSETESKQVEPKERPANDAPKMPPVGKPPIVIQATCFEAKNGFCSELGLVNPDGHVMTTLNEREKKMFQTLIRAKKETKELDILGRPNIRLLEGQTGELRSAANAKGIAITRELSYQNAPVIKLAEPKCVDTNIPVMRLGVTPKFSHDGSEITLTIDVEATRDGGIVRTEFIADPNARRFPSPVKQVLDRETFQLKLSVRPGELVFVGKVNRSVPDTEVNTELFWVLTPHVIRGDEK